MESTPCTDITTFWAPSSSRTISGSAARATPRSSRRSAASPRKKCGPPAFSGPSRRASWCRTYEGFSEDPAIVKELGEAATRGFQGADLANPLSVLACAKHYIGDGGTTYGTGTGRARGNDQGNTQVDEATLRRIHLPGYITTIKAGVGTIMPSYSSWNGVKCSASKRLLTEILKNELGFQGFLISDYNAVDQIDRDFKKAVALSINAGMDMVM